MVEDLGKEVANSIPNVHAIMWGTIRHDFVGQHCRGSLT